jgi:hypothetical protein
MSRKLRIEYPGAIYHVMNRGDQREDIFRDDQDRQKFLSTLTRAALSTRGAPKTKVLSVAECLWPGPVNRECSSNL